jgi:hypothetical protein
MHKCLWLAANIAQHSEHHGTRVCRDEHGKPDMVVAAGVTSAILS